MFPIERIYFQDSNGSAVRFSNDKYKILFVDKDFPFTKEMADEVIDWIMRLGTSVARMRMIFTNGMHFGSSISIEYFFDTQDYGDYFSVSNAMGVDKIIMDSNEAQTYLAEVVNDMVDTYNKEIREIANV